MSFKLITFCLFFPKVEPLHVGNLYFAPLTAKENTKRHKRWEIVPLSYTRVQSIRHKLASSNKKKKRKEDAHDICHSIPTLWSMIWSQRSYVLADSQSIFRAEATDRRSQREGETLLVCVLSFLFFKHNTSIHHVSSLRGPPRDVYQRKWIFKALPAHKNDWEHVRKHKSLSTVSGHFRGRQYALKDGVFFQPIITRCMKAFS